MVQTSLAAFLAPSEKTFGAMGKKRVSGTRADSHSPRQEASQSKRERDFATERESERERERERQTGANTPQRAFQKYENKPYAKIFSGNSFAKLRKETLRKIRSRRIIYRKLRIGRIIPEKITSNTSQGIIFVIILCQRVFMLGCYPLFQVFRDRQPA